MAREGTRSATGNSRPRIFSVPEPVVTKPRKKRATKTGTTTGKGRKTGTTTKTSAKPAGVTKRKAPAKKTSLGDKVKGEIKKVEGALTKNPEKKAAGTKKIRGTDGSKTHKK